MTVRTAAAAGARCSPVAIAPKRIVTTCAASRSRKHELKLVLLNIVAAGVEPRMSKAGSLAEHRELSLPRGPRSNVGRGSESDRCGVLAFVAPDSGLPGRMKSSCTPNWYAHASIARLQNSVPLSTTAHGSILVSHPRFSGAMPCPFLSLITCFMIDKRKG